MLPPHLHLHTAVGDEKIFIVTAVQVIINHGFGIASVTADYSWRNKTYFVCRYTAIERRPTLRLKTS